MRIDTGEIFDIEEDNRKSEILRAYKESLRDCKNVDRTKGSIMPRVPQHIIPENSVQCPNDKNKIDAMRTWGKKKRQRYAFLVKIEHYTEDKAFEIVEHNQGRI